MSRGSARSTEAIRRASLVGMKTVWRQCMPAKPSGGGSGGAPREKKSSAMPGGIGDWGTRGDSGTCRAGRLEQGQRA